MGCLTLFVQTYTIWVTCIEEIISIGEYYWGKKRKELKEIANHPNVIPTDEKNRHRNHDQV